MTALSDKLAKAKADGAAALIGYLPVGYPSVDVSIEAMRAMVDGGADVIEVGVPYSDPVMDVRSSRRRRDPAVRAGVGHRRAARRGGRRRGRRRGGRECRTGPDRPLRHRTVRGRPRGGGCSGAITPTTIPTKPCLDRASDQHGLDRVSSSRRSSPTPRIASTSAACRGFVYAHRRWV